jgi:hypothetical protein
VQGSAAGNAQLTISANQTNAGTLRLESVSDGFNSNIVIASGNLTNTSVGVIAVNAGTGGGRTFTGELVNAGTLTITGTTLALASPTANYVNSGTILLTGAGLTVSGNNMFVNQPSGVITASDTTDAIDVSNDPLNNDGTINVFSGATLSITGRLLNFNPNLHTLIEGSYHIAGSLGLDGANIASLSADLELTNLNSRVINNQGGADALANNLTTITSSGTLVFSNRNFTAGTLTNAGTLSVRDGSTLTVTGTYSQSGTLSIATAGTVLLNGTFTNFNPATNTLTNGTFAIAGAADLPSTLLFQNANIVTNAANLILDGPGAQILNQSLGNALANFATIMPAGHFTLLDGANFATAVIPNFENDGILTIGAGCTFTVNGNFTQSGSGTLDVQLGGPPASGQFGKLVVTGQANLGGKLQIDLVNGYAPNPGDSFIFITFATRNGDFTMFNIPPGGVWDPNTGSVTF